MPTKDLREACEQILVDHDAADLCLVIEPRRREDAFADLRLVFGDRSWLQSNDAARLVGSLCDHPLVAKAQRKKSTVQIRFHDEAIGDLEAELAAEGLAAGSVDAPARTIVSYIGPNTNKALHVGHLRNIYIGEALACSLEVAGAGVTRLNLVGDIGRRVCEAMAGYAESYSGTTPEQAGIPGDRFVELCCREYSKRRSARSGVGGDPNSEERKSLGDKADLYMQAWLKEGEAERGLWRQLRDWTIEGHNRTLTRLGIVFDEYDFESRAVPHAMELIEEGIDRGLFEREEGGGVVFRTGQSEYPTLVLVRDDGFPTEHSRLLGAYDEILAELQDDEAYLEVAGYEWQASIIVICRILELLRPGARNEANLRVFHGSLTEGDNEKIGSSTGAPVWIDDFIDMVEAGPAVAALEKLCDGCVSRQELADLLIRGSFLCAPATRPMPFAPEAIIEGRPGPGWTIAEAWCRARLVHEHGWDGQPSPRTVVMQSQQFPVSLQRTVERHDVTSLSRYLLGLAELCAMLPTPGPAAAPMLECALGALGFLAGKDGSRARRRDLEIDLAGDPS
jgi:arginyl-tRNA synthetase